MSVEAMALDLAAELMAADPLIVVESATASQRLEDRPTDWCFDIRCTHPESGVPMLGVVTSAAATVDACLVDVEAKERWLVRGVARLTAALQRCVELFPE